MGLRSRILLLAAPIAMLLPQSLPAVDRPVSIRVGNLANKGELARFERRVWEGCRQEAKIQLQRQASSKPPGRVVGQHPPRGTRIGCDAAAAILYVSAGPPDAILYVPALVDPAQRRDFARQLRKACRAPVAIAEQYRPYPLPPGRFVDQSPAQGVRYRCGTPIEVRISAGPRADTRTTQKPLRAQPVASPVRKAPAPPAQRPAPQLAEAPLRLPVPAQAQLQPQVEPQAQPPAATPTPPPAQASPIASGQALVEVETIAPPVIPARPTRAARPDLIAPSLAVLLLAALLVAVMLRRVAPQPRPAAAHVADRAARRPEPVAPLLRLVRGWPSAEARLLPPVRVSPGPAVDTLPPVPLLRDLLRPLDPALDWISGTPLAALGDQPVAPGAEAETLATLRPDLAEALHFAMLFELPPLLARAWAMADHLPLLDQGPPRGWCRLAPHSIAIEVTPDLQLQAAGLVIDRPQLRLRLLFTFPAARLFLRGTALDAFEPGSVHAAASLDWGGQTRPLAVLRPHTDWPGSVAVTPPLQVHGLPGRLKAVG
jgi:hypothetical protein